MDRKKVHEFLKLINAEKIKDRGEWVGSSCPFAYWTHESKSDYHPSFGITVDANSYFNCFSCHRKAPLHFFPTLYGQFTGRNMDHLRKFLTKNEGLFDFKKDKIKTSNASAIPEEVLQTFANIKPVRGLTKKTIKQFELKGDKNEHRLIIPIRDVFGRLISVRGRYLGNNNGTLRYREYSEFTTSSPKSHGIWFGIDKELKPDKKLILVEGEIDAMLLKQSGLANVWASMGSSLANRQIDTLRNVSNSILMFFDDDKAGHSTRREVYKKCKGLMPIYSVTKYYGQKDPDKIIQKGLLKQVLRSVDKHQPTW